MVQVHHDEGVANRIDPESCADAREGIGEALTGERIGQPLSRESTLILGADVVPLTEGNTDGRDSASAQTAQRGLIPHLIDQNPCAHWRSPMDMIFQGRSTSVFQACLLYTSDAADDLTRVDLGGRRI